MTEEEYCITTNLERLRVAFGSLRHIHECDLIPADELRSISVAIDKAMERHSEAVQKFMVE